MLTSMRAIQLVKKKRDLVGPDPARKATERVVRKEKSPSGSVAEEL